MNHNHNLSVVDFVRKKQLGLNLRSLRSSSQRFNEGVSFVKLNRNRTILQLFKMKFFKVVKVCTII